MYSSLSCRYHVERYTVGWICTISTEVVAACLFLDEEHERPEYVSDNDSNDYTLGKMAGHHVVIAARPAHEYGLESAACVATDLLSSFPNIKVVLLVGIGGGAPSDTHDIRLGDVVVSTSRDETSGVCQYDFDKAIQGCGFQQTGFLARPPTEVLMAVSQSEANYLLKGHNIEGNIRTILEKKPSLRERYNRPPIETDHLYKAAHNCKDSCEKLCGTQSSVTIERRERDDDEDNPSIHYGPIASASQLMNDALVRNTIAKEKGILCFETSAAGLTNWIPSLVIRGICDYSDSHRNEKWHGYAAMTAAAYAKDLLETMPSSWVENEGQTENPSSSSE